MSVFDHFVGLVLKRLRTNLRTENSRGQSYDSAGAMKGKKSTVATKFKSLNGKILSVHCYGDTLNLVVKDACFKVKCLRETFEAVREISLLVKNSPNRNTKLEGIYNQSNNDAKIIHTFSPAC